MQLFTKLNNDDTNKYKLIIRLAKKGTLSSNTTIIAAQKLLRGFPIITYINKQDTLQNIINKCILNIDGITIDKTYHLKDKNG